MSWAQNLRQVVIFRRGDDWRLLGTIVDVRQAMRGQDLCPASEIWLRDSDVVIVPKHLLRQTTDVIDLVFTRGIYAVFPVFFSVGSTTL